MYVLRSGAEVNELACALLTYPLPCLDQWDKRMRRFFDAFAYIVQVDMTKVGLFIDGLGCPVRYNPKIGLGRGQSSLYLYPALVPVFVAEDLSGFVGCIAVAIES